MSGPRVFPLLDEQIEELQLVIAEQRTACVRRVRAGHMRQEAADRRVARLEAALITVMRIRREVVG